jgi:hypothetical protein
MSLEQVSRLWLVQEQGLAVSHKWIYHYVPGDKRRGGTRYRTCAVSAGVATATVPRSGEAEFRDGSLIKCRICLDDSDPDTIIGYTQNNYLLE